jgi:RNA polymerase sigma factor (sigma-70 family)
MEPLAFERSPSSPSGGARSSESTAVLPIKPASLAELFEAEESALLHFAVGLVGRRSVAEELVQETFLRLHPIWDDVENPRGWLYRSLRNLALNHLRDRKPETELDAQTAAEDGLAPEALGREEAVGLVRLLLAEMPPADRDLVRLKYHEDLKYQDISKRTGLSVGNIGYRLHHVLKSLGDALRRAGIEGSQG